MGTGLKQFRLMSRPAGLKQLTTVAQMASELLFSLLNYLMLTTMHLQEIYAHIVSLDAVVKILD